MKVCFQLALTLFCVAGALAAPTKGGFEPFEQQKIDTEDTTVQQQIQQQQEVQRFTLPQEEAVAPVPVHQVSQAYSAVNQQQQQTQQKQYFGGRVTPTTTHQVFYTPKSGKQQQPQATQPSNYASGVVTHSQEQKSESRSEQVHQQQQHQAYVAQPQVVQVAQPVAQQPIYGAGSTHFTVDESGHHHQQPHQYKSLQQGQTDTRSTVNARVQFYHPAIVNRVPNPSQVQVHTPSIVHAQVHTPAQVQTPVVQSQVHIPVQSQIHTPTVQSHTPTQVRTRYTQFHSPLVGHTQLQTQVVSSGKSQVHTPVQTYVQAPVQSQLYYTQPAQEFYVNKQIDTSVPVVENQVIYTHQQPYNQMAYQTVNPQYSFTVNGNQVAQKDYLYTIEKPHPVYQPVQQVVQQPVQSTRTLEVAPMMYFSTSFARPVGTHQALQVQRPNVLKVGTANKHKHVTHVTIEEVPSGYRHSQPSHQVEKVEATQPTVPTYYEHIVQQPQKLEQSRVEYAADEEQQTKNAKLIQNQAVKSPAPVKFEQVQLSNEETEPLRLN